MQAQFDAQAGPKQRPKHKARASKPRAKARACTRSCCSWGAKSASAVHDHLHLHGLPAEGSVCWQRCGERQLHILAPRRSTSTSHLPRSEPSTTIQQQVLFGAPVAQGTEHILFPGFWFRSELVHGCIKVQKPYLLCEYGSLRIGRARGRALPTLR